MSVTQIDDNTARVSLSRRYKVRAPGDEMLPRSGEGGCPGDFVPDSKSSGTEARPQN
jgi:hypothetical protein